ncbi:divalent-cation tolerance protein CutA [Wolbachia endosymbiont of Ctenocephalides felis wCfeT]|uniref:divalent-cation tolerance protein CutA n=1 Tax=Wolbachia endosymbiont of Ctenocephalides felis wCfeT TaxID=2732593 RepID=UPI00144863AA
MSSLDLIYTTFSSTEEAKFISERLLDDKLIACVNIFPEVSSLYLWNGKINSSCEVVAIMKSNNSHIDKIIERIEAMHSYDQPVIAVIPIEKANKSFTNWVNSVINVSSIGV